jgi:phosphoribosylformimino-5-aminoimidazole carboxamide ribonucleotide (ProFAR) isomerase
VAWALQFAGFTQLLLTDVDASRQEGENRDLVRDLLRQIPLPIQVGGGIREQEQLLALLDDGAHQVVIGSRGVEDPFWLQEQAALVPGQLVLALEVRGHRVLLRRGGRDSGRDVFDLLADLDASALGGVLLSTGPGGARIGEPEFALLEEFAERSPWPVTVRAIATSMQDLHNLRARELSSVVLETSAAWPADPSTIAAEFAH